MRNHTDDTESGRRTRLRTQSAERGVLEGVGRSETITDHTDLDRIEAELPEGWSVRPDLIQTDADPLVETLLFRRSITEPQLVLRPADPTTPAENIECYEKSGPRTTRERTMTVDRLEEALRVAVNRIHQLDR